LAEIACYCSSNAIGLSERMFKGSWVGLLDLRFHLLGNRYYNFRFNCIKPIFIFIYIFLIIAFLQIIIVLLIIIVLFFYKLIFYFLLILFLLLEVRKLANCSL
jgi:predicted membrane protein